jgi:hypothetical protein
VVEHCVPGLLLAAKPRGGGDQLIRKPTTFPKNKIKCIPGTN